MNLIHTQSIVLPRPIGDIYITKGTRTSTLALNVKEDCFFRGIHDSECTRSNCLSWEPSPLEIKETL